MRRWQLIGDQSVCLHNGPIEDGGHLWAAVFQGGPRAMLDGASALVAPLWAVAVLVALWLVQFVLACRWFSRRPYAVLAMPVVALVVWLSAIVAGDALLGWTA